MPDPKKPEDENEEEEALSPAQVKAINAAVASQLKRNLKDVLTKADIETLSSTIVEQVKSALPPAPKEEKTGGGKGKGDETNPELKKMQERFDLLEKANKQAVEAAAAEKRGRLLDKAQADIHRSLFVEGIGEKKQKAKPDYAELLTEAFGRKLKVTEDGQVVMTIRKAPVKGMPEEDADVSVAEGLASWIKSDAARAYLPAPSTGGRKVESRTQQARTQAVTTTTARKPADDLDSLVENAAADMEARGIDFNKL